MTIRRRGGERQDRGSECRDAFSADAGQRVGAGRIRAQPDGSCGTPNKPPFRSLSGTTPGPASDNELRLSVAQRRDRESC